MPTPSTHDATFLRVPFTEDPEPQVRALVQDGWKLVLMYEDTTIRPVDPSGERNQRVFVFTR